MTIAWGAAASAAVLPPAGTDEGATMQATYDPTVDVLAVTLVDAKRARSAELTRDTIVHFDGRDRLIELEILRASERYPRAVLEGFASPAEWLTLTQAAKESGLAPVTLRLQLQKGRIVGTKRGRDWLLSRAALVTYLDHRAPAGRPADRRKARRKKVQTSGKA